MISRHLMLFVCAGKDGSGNLSMILQLEDRRLGVWNNNTPELLITTLEKPLETV